MPIPDAVVPNDDYREQQAAEQRKQAAATKAIIDTCNALLKKQLECGKACHNCLDKCQELQTWLDMEEKK